MQIMTLKISAKAMRLAKRSLVVPCRTLPPFQSPPTSNITTSIRSLMPSQPSSLRRRKTPTSSKPWLGSKESVIKSSKIANLQLTGSAACPAMHRWPLVPHLITTIRSSGISRFQIYRQFSWWKIWKHQKFNRRVIFKLNHRYQL